MAKVSELGKKIVEFLREHCTESDDHDHPFDECGKCRVMATQLSVLIRAERDAARAEAIEECAKIADESYASSNLADRSPKRIAAAIRGIKP